MIAPLNFSNHAQKTAGLSLSASDYLRLEGVSGIALQIAGEIHGVDLPDVNGPELNDEGYTLEVADFERLVIDAKGPYEAFGHGDDSGLHHVVSLCEWVKIRGANPSRFLARLAAQLDWK